VIGLLELGRRHVAEWGEQAASVVPRDPLQGRELDVLQALPGAPPVDLLTFYSCAWHRKRGPEVCGNEVVLRQELVDLVVLEAIRNALDDRVVHKAVDLALERLQGDKAPDEARRSQLGLELAAVEQRIQRGLDALLDGSGAPEELQARLREEKARKQALTEELERLRGREVVVSLDAARLKRDLAKRVKDMVGLLSRHTAQARQVLRRLLVDKIDMLPVIEAGRRGYRLSGRLTFGRLLQGEAAQLVQVGGNSRTVVAPTGFERLWTLSFRGFLPRPGPDWSVQRCRGWRSVYRTRFPGQS